MCECVYIHTHRDRVSHNLARSAVTYLIGQGILVTVSYWLSYKDAW